MQNEVQPENRGEKSFTNLMNLQNINVDSHSLSKRNMQPLTTKKILTWKTMEILLKLKKKLYIRSLEIITDDVQKH